MGEGFVDGLEGIGQGVGVGISMAILAVLIFVVGIYPGAVFALLPQL